MINYLLKVWAEFFKKRNTPLVQILCGAVLIGLMVSEMYYSINKETAINIPVQPHVTLDSINKQVVFDSSWLKMTLRHEITDQINDLKKEIHYIKSKIDHPAKTSRMKIIPFIIILIMGVLLILFTIQKSTTIVVITSIAAISYSIYYLSKSRFNIEIDEVNINWNNQVESDSIYSFIDSSLAFQEGQAMITPEQKSHLDSIGDRMRNKYFISLSVYGGVDKRSLRKESYKIYRDNQTLAQIRADEIKNRLTRILDRDSTIIKPFIESTIRGASYTGEDSSLMASTRKVLIAGNYFNRVIVKESRATKIVERIVDYIFLFIAGISVGYFIREFTTYLKLKKKLP